MKKILSILAISFSALMASGLTTAAPHQNDDRDQNSSRGMQGKHKHEFRGGANGDDIRVEKRRIREERGVQRLQQFRWQEGYVLPQHYRGNGYKVSYEDNNLAKPSRNEQWYKINNNFLLVNLESNTILRINEL